MSIGYKLKINGGSYSNRIIDVGGNRNYTFPVETGVQYTVQVASYDDAGNQSAWSAPVTNSTSAPDLSPTISTNALPSGSVNATYNQTIAVSGGDGAIAFAVRSGTLPAGVNLNPSTGVLSGKPTTAGTYNFIIRVTDADGDLDEKALSITVNPAAAETNADAAAFVVAAAISDSVQQSAIAALVADLKSAGIWAKMKAIYPMVGGTEIAHKLNLKDPRDDDAAYRLTFIGNWTHSASGALPDGMTAYADTHLNPKIALKTNEGSLGYLSRANATGGDMRVEIGCLNKGAFHIQTNYSGSFCATAQGNVNLMDFMANTDSSGFFQCVRTGAATTLIQKNSAQKTFTNRDYIAADAFVFLGARATGYGAAQYYSNQECAFASIGNSLTATEAAAFHTIVQAFQTTLNRALY